MKEAILLLDDDLTTLTVLERALGGSGFNCRSSNDPKQAQWVSEAERILQELESKEKPSSEVK